MAHAERYVSSRSRRHSNRDLRCCRRSARAEGVSELREPRQQAAEVCGLADDRRRLIDLNG